MAQEDLPAVPSVDRYVDAFRQIEDSIHPNHKKLLQAHYAAPARTMTVSELAAAVGYPNYESVNLQYGSLGARVRELMAYHEGDVALLVFAALKSPKTTGSDQWLLTMHDHVARALEKLGWV